MKLHRLLLLLFPLIGCFISSCEKVDVDEEMDDFSVPSTPALNISFTDNDLDKDEIGGNATITKAENEDEFDSYALYWGTDTKTKHSSSPITVLAKTGDNLVYSFPQNTYRSQFCTHRQIGSHYCVLLLLRVFH